LTKLTLLEAKDNEQIANGAVAWLLAFDDVEHRISVYIAIVIGGIFVGRIVDLFARAQAGD
jgi:hypothetical protein